MDFFVDIYHLFLYQPVFNALVWLSQTLPGQDFGVAVILLTLAVRAISYPLGRAGRAGAKKDG
jgi:membrane protein insertase Oxa1/YidC/SpoIIIJ